MKRAVFLDRDGVLNEAILRGGKPCPPANETELRIPSGTAEALATLRDRGFLLFVVTNQPDVARRKQTRECVERIHKRLQDELSVDAIFTCYHDDSDQCDCRKPKPGLLTAAAGQYGVDLRDSFLIGDRWRDIDAGASAGCRTIWIDHSYSERAPESTPDRRVSTLDEAVQWILAQAAKAV